MHDLRITLVQTSMIWEDVRANFAHYDSIFHSIPSGSTDLIVLPEMFSTGFSMKPEKFLGYTQETQDWMSAWAKEKNAVICGSIVAEENGKRKNRLLWIRPDGTFEHYDKRHLFRYANEQEHYSGGNFKLITELKGWNICPLICYDLRFPNWIRNKVIDKKSGKLEYDLLIFVANWPERRNHPWKTLLSARAMENQSYVAGVNRIGVDGNLISHSGDSGIIDPKGDWISTMKSNEEKTETIVLSKQILLDWRKTFPAWMDADDFEIKN